MTNTCCHPDCDASVPKGHIACIKHWRQINGETVRAVQERLRGWKSEYAAREFLSNYFRSLKAKGTQL
jgi:hypothetical protein